ncbi:MAG: hypothetical protein ACLFVC_08470 [Opitutales bacterium]
MSATATEFRRRACRGSALITSIIFSFIVGLLAVSFLKLAGYEYSSAVRSTLYSSSLNLAESGIEMGIEALSEGSTSGSIWAKRVDGFLVDRGYVGDVRLVIFDADELEPTIYAEGIIGGHRSGPVMKQVKATLSSGFQPFAMGFSARNGITFSGNNVLLDSYNSNYGEYGASLGAEAPAEYGVAGRNKNDDIFVASDRINAEGETAIDQGNADIYGYVTVSPDSTVSIGPNGVVTTYDSGAHDPSRVLGDFYADFPPEPHPSGSYDASHTMIGSSTTVTGSSVKDSPKYYDVSKISLSGNNKTLAISGHVALVMSGDISVTGKGSITIQPDSSLTIYTADDVSIAGNGVVNLTNTPSNFYLYGTAAETVDADGNTGASQNISISGNGQLSSTVYAPSAHVTLNGGGNAGKVMGGVVAFTAKVTGGSSFHFDEALREIIVGGGVYEVDSWLELTGVTAGSKAIDLDPYF